MVSRNAFIKIVYRKLINKYTHTHSHSDMEIYFGYVSSITLFYPITYGVTDILLHRFTDIVGFFTNLVTSYYLECTPGTTGG
jgi:hypothetical protein